MKVRITKDENVEEIEVQPRFDSLTMREMVSIEEALGVKGYDEFMAMTAKGEDPRPSQIRAMTWAKVRSIRPDVKLEEFDFDIIELIGEADSPLDEASAES